MVVYLLESLLELIIVMVLGPAIVKVVWVVSLLKRSLASSSSERAILYKHSREKHIPPACWTQLVALVIQATLLALDLGLLATSSRCTSKVQACQVEATSISSC
jgi:hypothetical protein